MNVFELDASERDELLRDGKRLVLARGDFVYTPGDATDAVYFVAAGRVKIVRSRANGSEAIVGIRNPGDIFGELSWILASRSRNTSAVALDPSETIRLESATFERRIAADARLAAAFSRGLCERLAIAERELTELAGKSVPGRLVDALGRLAADHGISEQGAVRIGISLTHKDLADLIGTSRETLTKELAVLADIGLLRVSHRTIVLLQPRAFPFALRPER